MWEIQRNKILDIHIDILEMEEKKRQNTRKKTQNEVKIHNTQRLDFCKTPQRPNRKSTSWIKLEETPRPKSMKESRSPRNGHKIKTPKSADIHTREEILPNKDWTRRIYTSKKKKNLPATPQSETPESRVEERKKKHSHIISLTMLIFIFFSFFSLWVKAKLKATVSKWKAH